VRIAIVSDSETAGGAAVAASRLAGALAAAGHEIVRIVSIPDGRSHPWSTRRAVPPYARSRYYRLGRLAVNCVADGVLDERMAERWLGQALGEVRPDVINVHNLHSAGMRPSLVRVCAGHAPTFWTLHDMWSFTGRCAYSFDCRKFLTGCDASCPTPAEHPALSPRRIPGAWRKRKQLLSDCLNITAVTPSRWLAREAAAGLWSGHRVEVIPYGLPLGVYQPIDKQIARTALGIRCSGPVLLVAAQGLTERRKGGDFLVEALRRLSMRPVTLITLGSGRLDVPDDLQLHELGYVDHERTKVLAYNAADILVHPAPVDNFPNVVMESMACGTPVVGFRTGGVPELVRPGLTGWLADEISARCLSEALGLALSQLGAGVDLSEACRSTTVHEYDESLQAARYVCLFGESAPGRPERARGEDCSSESALTCR